MTATDEWRGHRIHFDEQDERWRYSDTNDPVADVPERPCGHCGLPNTPEGHDGCLGTLPGVVNACCGHGGSSESFIQFESGIEVRGFDRVERAIWAKGHEDLARQGAGIKPPTGGNNDG